MPELTREQEAALVAKMREFYSARPATSKADTSVKRWWATRADRVREKMLGIDRDQMRSVAQSLSKWVR